MSGRVPYAELNAVRALVADTLAELTAAGDISHLWIRAACTRLSALDAALTEAAGVLAAPVQVLAATTVTFLLVFLSTTVGSAVGLSTAGLVVTAAVTVLLTAAVTPWVSRRTAAALGRHRLSRSPLPHGIERPHLGTGRLADPGLRFPSGTNDEAHGKGRIGGSRGPLTGDRAGPGPAAIPDRLLDARVRLVSVAMRQAGPADWSAPLLRRAIRTDPVIRRLARADQLLCQAVDCVERHLDDLPARPGEDMP
ncbi:hypothetical protein [Actinoplanes couchii]|uniref:Integral membrane protein n=1 Tax=Actinoplanes couchii TaxID=403638 RepID=A0ABQ3X949_9ACTN|nr:hypothetical protein [Actinoplanes couchii]MDR6325854.1 hypothetical protein [Actinoplanes couchii]GID54979.1 hypothetical protein Aco03nite_033830 [Actinoplanes couchii]